MKIFTFTLLISFVFCDENLEKISFKSPELNEEEQFSTHMPGGLECDACTAIAYQMKTQLEKAEIGGKRMKESEYLDVFETICSGKTWDGYGLKEVKGVNRLSGDGLPSKDFPGMMYGGGKWPGRLSNKCFDYVGEIGEDELYQVFRSRNDFQTYLCQEASTDCNSKYKSEL